MLGAAIFVGIVLVCVILTHAIAIPVINNIAEQIDDDIDLGGN